MNDAAKLSNAILASLRRLGSAARREAAQRVVVTELTVLGVDAPRLRRVVREYTPRLRPEPAATVRDLARALVDGRALEARQVGYELLAGHRAAFAALDARELRRLGKGNDNWASVDGFALALVGPCWLVGRIRDADVVAWARSKDVWWQRTAVVATTGLNKKSRGGAGDPARTLRICRLFVADHRPMISKALSWALRELGKRRPAEAAAFVDEYEARLAGHVVREVRRKLATGRKDGRGARS